MCRLCTGLEVDVSVALQRSHLQGGVFSKSSSQQVSPPEDGFLWTRPKPRHQALYIVYIFRHSLTLKTSVVILLRLWKSFQEENYEQFVKSAAFFSSALPHVESADKRRREMPIHPETSIKTAAGIMHRDVVT